MSRHKYTKEQEEFLKDNVKGKFYKDLAKDFNLKFNTKLNGNAIRQKCYALGVKSDYTLGSRENYKPPSTLPVGAESIDEDGNPIIKIAQPKKWRKKSHIVWEKEHGPVPKNHFVIFLNRDKKDCRIENLVLVSKPTFYRLVHSGLYTGDEEVTRAGITIALLKQKIAEYEKEAKKRR